MPTAIGEALKRVLLALSGAAILGGSAPAGVAPPLLAQMFQEHAVLQRDRAIPVWGDARPGARVTVAINGQTANASADASGHWRATFAPMPAGGPYSLTAQTAEGASQSIGDILIGDVFLCSGQSNMELPVSATLNADSEIAGANNPSIRLLDVADAISATPRRNFLAPVSWAAASPDSVRNFSAACYYFARELTKTIRVPIGLIQASWNGSHIETWMSDGALRSVGGFEDRLDALRLFGRDTVAANDRLGEMWQTWWAAHAPAGSAPWRADAPTQDWPLAPEPMRDWKTWGPPELATHNGMLWFRRDVQLSAAQAAQGATLSLGEIDEVDETWVNGRPIGASFGWGAPRTYRVPPDVLHAGANAIVVNVLSTWDAGGMFGPADQMALRFADGSAAPLGAQWRYNVVPAGMGNPPQAPWVSIVGLSGAHNAMVAPIGPYALRGVAWYQGESNTSGGDQYQKLLTTLIAQWRGQFGADLPVLIVQLPNFGAAVTAPVASGWSDVREAQRRTVLADAHAGLAVTIDVGLYDQLHPPNKQAVGIRLARAARHVIYGEAIFPSGPEPQSAHRAGGQVIVSFHNVEGSLISYSAARPIGFELCGGEQASCRFADASIQGDRVALDVPSGAAPTRVRFCWGDGPVCTLYDRSGLPAGPFELAIQ